MLLEVLLIFHNWKDRNHLDKVVCYCLHIKPLVPSNDINQHAPDFRPRATPGTKYGHRLRHGVAKVEITAKLNHRKQMKSYLAQLHVMVHNRFRKVRNL